MIINTEDLRKSYGDFEALKGISVSINEGKIGLLGPNGAGKTTFIKVILGLLEYNEGRVSVFGQEVRGGEKSIRSKIGYMPESDAVIPDMTGIEFVTYMGMLSGMPPTDAMQRAHEVLHYVGLEEVRYRSIETYSTGMRQRVKLAQALVHDPDLLILDEPTNGMDPAGRDDMLKLINDIAKRANKNIFLSSHILEDVERVCESVLILGSGNLLAYGKIDELLLKDKNNVAIKFSGDAKKFISNLKKEGVEFFDDDDGNLSVKAENDEVMLFVMKAAKNAGVEIRRISDDIKTLDEVYFECLKNQEVEL